MSGSCPRCGFEPVDKAECPRCGTMVAFYREAMLSRLETLPPGVVVGPPSASPRPVELAAGRAAGFWIRGVAVFIDGLFLLAVGFAVEVLIRAIFGEAADDSTVLRAANRAFEVVFGALYGILFHWLWGQTFGKMAMRIRVVMLDGTPLGLGVSALRYLGSLVSALLFGIGYLMAGIRADRRALHDLIAGTRVEHVG